MTKASPIEESITSTSLSSIIRKSLTKLASTVRSYEEARPLLKSTICALRVEKFRDQKSIDARSEQLQIWDNAILGYELLTVIADRIDTNPFPSERLTLREVVFRLMPDVRKSVWATILEVYELNPSSRHYFPAMSDWFDIAEVENQLMVLLNGRVAVPVCEAKKVLHWQPRSTTYLSAKKSLEERGWKWVRSKAERKIVAPAG